MPVLNCYSCAERESKPKNVQEKLAALAEQALELSKNTLALHLRLLCPALTVLENKITDGTICTDGECLMYNPTHVLKIFRKDSTELTRDYLHVLLHCVFRHPYVASWIHAQYWNLACDIAVENVISSLGVRDFSCAREYGQKPFVTELHGVLESFTAEEIYEHLVHNRISERRLKELVKHFSADDHMIWYQRDEQSKQRQDPGNSVELPGKSLGPSTDNEDSSSGGSVGGDKDGADGDEDSSDTESTGESKNAALQHDKKGQPSTSNGKVTLFSSSTSKKAQQEKLWERIATQIVMELEVFSKLQGEGTGDLLQILTAPKREKYDYTEFLKKFAVRCEVQKVNDEEFDYIPYTYGLKKYGNMPLVEPLEYADCKRIKDFVIAIDTSGSTQGDLVQAFVQKTYNVLKSTESFYKKVNIHIMQCDMLIQKDDTITTLKDLDAYAQRMKIYGGGGTDFRPVFNHVEQLRKERKLRNLKGLIYLTDGIGCYPEKRPSYTTAFVFIKESFHDTRTVPPWAIKIELSEEEL